MKKRRSALGKKKCFLYLTGFTQLILATLSSHINAAEQLPKSNEQAFSYTSSQKQHDEDKWPMFLQLEGKKGRFRDLSRLSWMIPIWQNENDLLFGDIRYMMDNRKDREGNFGIGYRHIIRDFDVWSDGIILGAYAFYDRKRSTFHNYFNQGTFGVEALSQNYQARFNYYLPQNRAHLISKSVSASDIQPGWNLVGGGNAAFTYSTTVNFSTHKEYSLKGYDAEVKIRAPISDSLQAWLGGGAYHFSRGSLVKKGPMAQVDLELLNGLKITGSRLALGYEYRKDKGAKANQYGVLKLSLPLSSSFGGQNGEMLNSIDYQMTRFIERDVDVQSGAQVNTSPYHYNNAIELDIVAKEVTDAASFEDAVFNGWIEASKGMIPLTVVYSQDANAGIEISDSEVFDRLIARVQSSSDLSSSQKSTITNELNHKTIPIVGMWVSENVSSTSDLKALLDTTINENMPRIHNDFLAGGAALELDDSRELIRQISSYLDVTLSSTTNHTDLNHLQHIANIRGGFAFLPFAGVDTLIDLPVTVLYATAKLSDDKATVNPAFDGVSRKIRPYSLVTLGFSNTPEATTKGHLITYQSELDFMLASERVVLPNMISPNSAYVVTNGIRRGYGLDISTFSPSAINNLLYSSDSSLASQSLQSMNLINTNIAALSVLSPETKTELAKMNVEKLESASSTRNKFSYANHTLGALSAEEAISNGKNSVNEVAATTEALCKVLGNYKDSLEKLQSGALTEEEFEAKQQLFQNTISGLRDELLEKTARTLTLTGSDDTYHPETWGFSTKIDTIADQVMSGSSTADKIERINGFQYDVNSATIAAAKMADLEKLNLAKDAAKNTTDSLTPPSSASSATDFISNRRGLMTNSENIRQTIVALQGLSQDVVAFVRKQVDQNQLTVDVHNAINGIQAQDPTVSSALSSEWSNVKLSEQDDVDSFLAFITAEIVHEKIKLAHSQSQSAALGDAFRTTVVKSAIDDQDYASASSNARKLGLIQATAAGKILASQAAAQQSVLRLLRQNQDLSTDQGVLDETELNRVGLLLAGATAAASDTGDMKLHTEAAFYCNNRVEAQSKAAPDVVFSDTSSGFEGLNYQIEPNEERPMAAEIEIKDEIEVTEEKIKQVKKILSQNENTYMRFSQPGSNLGVARITWSKVTDTPDEISNQTKQNTKSSVENGADIVGLAKFSSAYFAASANRLFENRFSKEEAKPIIEKLWDTAKASGLSFSVSKDDAVQLMDIAYQMKDVTDVSGMRAIYSTLGDNRIKYLPAFFTGRTKDKRFGMDLILDKVTDPVPVLNDYMGFVQDKNDDYAADLVYDTVYATKADSSPYQNMLADIIEYIENNEVGPKATGEVLGYMNNIEDSIAKNDEIRAKRDLALFLHDAISIGVTGGLYSRNFFNRDIPEAKNMFYRGVYLDDSQYTGVSELQLKRRFIQMMSPEMNLSEGDKETVQRFLDAYLP